MTTRIVHVDDRIEGAVYIGRAVPRRGLPESSFRNPTRITKDRTREEVIGRFRGHLADCLGLIRDLPALRDKPLACWCRHDGEERTRGNECHGDVLVGLLNRYTDEELVTAAAIWNDLITGEVFRAR